MSLKKIITQKVLCLSFICSLDASSSNPFFAPNLDLLDSTSSTLLSVLPPLENQLEIIIREKGKNPYIAHANAEYKELREQVTPEVKNEIEILFNKFFGKVRARIKENHTSEASLAFIRMIKTFKDILPNCKDFFIDALNDQISFVHYEQYFDGLVSIMNAISYYDQSKKTAFFQRFFTSYPGYEQNIFQIVQYYGSLCCSYGISKIKHNLEDSIKTFVFLPDFMKKIGKASNKTEANSFIIAGMVDLISANLSPQQRFFARKETKLSPYLCSLLGRYTAEPIYASLILDIDFRPTLQAINAIVEAYNKDKNEDQQIIMEKSADANGSLSSKPHMSMESLYDKIFEEMRIRDDNYQDALKKIETAQGQLRKKEFTYNFFTYSLAVLLYEKIIEISEKQSASSNQAKSFICYRNLVKSLKVEETLKKELGITDLNAEKVKEYLKPFVHNKQKFDFSLLDIEASNIRKILEERKIEKRLDDLKTWIEAQEFYKAFLFQYKKQKNKLSKLILDLSKSYIGIYKHENKIYIYLSCALNSPDGSPDNQFVLGNPHISVTKLDLSRLTEEDVSKVIDELSQIKKIENISVKKIGIHQKRIPIKHLSLVN